MTPVEAVPSEHHPRLETAAIEELRARTAAPLITSSSPEYGAARRVWNRMIDRRPAVIVRCRGVADVIAAADVARAHALPLAVRGGGHNVAGFGTCDGGVVLDLSPMRDVRVDPVARTARAGAGATWGDLDRETQVFGLAAPGGIVSTTGIGGLTLGGGQGWLRRTYGMACDSLLSADVVTADGQFLTASETGNNDLLWALRGGGGNFGVVTSFEYRLHPVGPMVAFAGPTYAPESAPAVLGGLRRLAADAGDELNISATWWVIPPAPDFPEHLHERPVLTIGALYVGPPEHGEARLRPFKELAEPLLDLSATMPYTALQQLFDPFFPAGQLNYYWKSTYLAGLDDDVVRTIAGHFDERPSPLSMVGLWALGGALARVDPTATATGPRDAPYVIEILANWADPSDNDVNIAWARRFFAALEPFSTGKTNFNFPGLGDEPGFARTALRENWPRLVEMKKRYDPTNLFHLNQNIPPD